MDKINLIDLRIVYPDIGANTREVFPLHMNLTPTDLCIGKDNRIWFSAKNNIIICVDPKKLEQKDIVPPWQIWRPSNNKDNDFTSIVCDSNGIIHTIGQDNKSYSFDGKSWSHCIIRGKRVGESLRRTYYGTGDRFIRRNPNTKELFWIGTLGSIKTFDGKEWPEIGKSGGIGGFNDAWIGKDNFVYGKSGIERPVYGVKDYYHKKKMRRFKDGEWQKVPESEAKGLYEEMIALRIKERTDNKGRIWQRGPHGGIGYKDSRGFNLLSWNNGYPSYYKKNRQYEINDVRFSTNGTWYAVGTKGLILKGDHNTIEKLDSPITANINGISIHSNNDIYVFGEKSQIYHFDNKKWTPVGDSSSLTVKRKYTKETSIDFKAILVRAPDDIFAVGSPSTIFHYDGETWTEVKTSVGTYNIWPKMARMQETLIPCFYSIWEDSGSIYASTQKPSTGEPHLGYNSKKEKEKEKERGGVIEIKWCDGQLTANLVPIDLPCAPTGRYHFKDSYASHGRWFNGSYYTRIKNKICYFDSGVWIDVTQLQAFNPYINKNVFFPVAWDIIDDGVVIVCSTG